MHLWLYLSGCRYLRWSAPVMPTWNVVPPTCPWHPQNRNSEKYTVARPLVSPLTPIPTVIAAAVCYQQLFHHWVNCLCVADASVLEFSAQTSNYKGVFRTNSVDMIDNLEAESDHSTDSYHSRMPLSSFSCLFMFKELTLVTGRMPRSGKLPVLFLLTG